MLHTFRFAALVLAASFLSGCATLRLAETYSAELGQTADALSTVAFMAQGIEEANPIIAANPVILAIKPFVPWALRELALLDGENGIGTCVTLNRFAGHIGWGAMGWNIGVMAGGGPAAVALALGAALLFTYPLEHGSRRLCGAREVVSDS